LYLSWVPPDSILHPILEKRVLWRLLEGDTMPLDEIGGQVSSGQEDLGPE
jgi:hypothetical protein